MSLVYLLGALFLGWLVAVVWKTWVLLRRKRPPKKLALVVRNQEERVEWFVRRVVSVAGSEPGLQVALVDGGSWDETPHIMERLAMRFNMVFTSLELMGSNCARTCTGMADVNNDSAGEIQFQGEPERHATNAGNDVDTGVRVKCTGACLKTVSRPGPASAGSEVLNCCLDLRGEDIRDIPEILKFL